MTSLSQNSLSTGLLPKTRVMKMPSKGPVSTAAMEERVTLPQVIHHMRTGQLINGPVQPYKWLEYATKPKTEQEIKIQYVMDGCAFKSLMSFVVGVCFMHYIGHITQN